VKAHYDDPFWGTFGFNIILHNPKCTVVKNSIWM
jgi:hypothetical protein